MVKNHLKKLVSPRSWKVKRKSDVYITRPAPGGHDMDHSMPLSVYFKNILKIAKTTKEVKIILNNKNVLINGTRKKDHRIPVGLFDVIEFKEDKLRYLVTIDGKGMISNIELTPDQYKDNLAKVKDISKRKEGVALRLFNGWNVNYDKTDIKTGDSVLLDTATKKVKTIIKFEKKAGVLLMSGKHQGYIGTIEDIEGQKVMVKVGDELIETLKKSIMVLDKKSPILK